MQFVDKHFGLSVRARIASAGLAGLLGLGVLAYAPAAFAAPAASPDDPTTVGKGTYSVADYDFGTQSVPLANVHGVRGEMEGRIYLPDGRGRHPLVVFMHGDIDSTCFTPGAAAGQGLSLQWPCPPGTEAVPSYAGYDGAGEALAKDGFVVVSVSANGINANDDTHSLDNGYRARGQLYLDTLTMLSTANAGRSVVFHDAATGKDVSLNQALSGGKITAAALAGSIDMSRIGLMGHSRGGEGAATAASLNAALRHPFDIRSIFAVAPTDFTRVAVPDVDMATILPYCDGDVFDQQGQHFYADSRHAFQDNVQRSDLWVMGADHNVFNSQWFPPAPAGSEDWPEPNDPVCGTNAPSRLTPPQQSRLGSAYIAGYFEDTLGGQTQFAGLFDGSGKLPPSVASFADVRTVAQQPASSREDVATFASNTNIRATGAATATVCASMFGLTVPQDLPACTDNPGDDALAFAKQPYFTPAFDAGNVPLNPMTRLTWTGSSGALTVNVPSRQQDVSAYGEMAVSMSPDMSVPAGQSADMTLSVTDSAGHTWHDLASRLNKWTVTRMPSSTSAFLGKIVLQQAHVPTPTLAAAGLNVHHIVKVTFTAASARGGEYLSDLMFDSKGLGRPDVQARPSVNIAPTTVEEGASIGTHQVGVYLSKPSSVPVTTFLSGPVLPFTGPPSGDPAPVGQVGDSLQKVTFAPGSTCQVAVVRANGDTKVGTSPVTAYDLGLSATSNAVLGLSGFGTVSVREDDGMPSTPPVGVQGNACAEHAALAHPGTLKVKAGSVTGSGFRTGESVAFTLGSKALGSAIANSEGVVTFRLVGPAGHATLKAVGAGSGFVETAAL
jgi:dienelactone hydrolase